jgi:short-subunit dehydrogenase
MTTPFRNALITGASSGIGRSLSLKLAARGTHVFAAARRLPELEQLAAEARERGGQVTPVQLDVLRPSEAIARIQALQREQGGLDLVLANAGVSVLGRAHKLTWDKVEPVLLTNLVGATAVLTAAIPDMVERKRGTLAGVSSLAGQYGLPLSAAYSASKAGLSTFLESLRPGLRRQGIRVIDLRPGFVRTPMTAGSKVPMPMALDVEEAADRMLAGLERGTPVVAFPAPLAGAAWLLRQLPNGLADGLSARLLGG